MNKAPILACHELRKSYVSGQRQNVLTGVNLAVQASESVAIIGSSGSGKTTLLHLLGGLDAPDSGTVEVAGRHLNELSDREMARWRNEHLAFVFQLHLLLPEFSALENVAMPLLLRRLPRPTALATAADWLHRVNLSAHQHKTPDQLSGGERQRVAIARALIGQPRCILADEPTGNLDKKNADSVFELLLSSCREHQAGLVLVSHDERLAARADRVLSINDGKLEAHR